MLSFCLVYEFLTEFIGVADETPAARRMTGGDVSVIPSNGFANGRMRSNTLRCEYIVKFC